MQDDLNTQQIFAFTANIGSCFLYDAEERAEHKRIFRCANFEGIARRKGGQLKFRDEALENVTVLWGCE